MLASRLGVVNKHLQCEVNDTGARQTIMTMLYKVGDGLLTEDRYGLCLARTLRFPERFLQVAEDVSSQLRDIEKASQAGAGNEVRLAHRRRLCLALAQNLQRASDSMTGRTLKGILKEMQSSFHGELENSFAKQGS